MTDPARVYLDTSLYVGILLGEPEALTATPWVAKKHLCSSMLLLVEAGAIRCACRGSGFWL